jgi:aspartyl-tRNA(Asn)/glutamyl-tRNA(Gln) amidotransferase subunit B
MAQAYETVIGLEVHAQLSTGTKIFCGCKTRFGAEPNSQTCPVCLGMPGVLPVLNKKAVEFAIKLGLATACRLNRINIFARKNYFYPDLPKGYQISQFEQPICEEGFMDIEADGETKRIGIRRIHLEEDAGKLVHAESYVAEDETLVDLNRCGVPLVEIVSHPDLNSPQEAHDYLFKLRQLLRYLEICDGNMEEGSLRCDANISMRPVNSRELGVRTELKNMNSFRHVQKALQYEIDRQTAILQAGGTVEQETLLWDPEREEARPMRDKEESHDYRYFPEPDLVAVKITAPWLAQIADEMPELPAAKIKRFMEQYQLSDYEAGIICSSKEMADYFEQTAKICMDYKLVGNWILGAVSRVLNETKIEITQMPISPSRLADLLMAIADQTISASAAKKVFEEALHSAEPIPELIKRSGLAQVSDTTALEAFVDQVLQKHPEEVELYRGGKTKVLGFLIGQVMKASAGKANPEMINTIMKKKLDTPQENS